MGGYWNPRSDLAFAPPFDPVSVSEYTRARTPDDVIEPVVSLDNRSRYEASDETRSIVDPDRDADYEQSVAPLRQFSEAVVRLANRFVASGGQNLKAASEAAGHLRTWAKAGALSEIRSVPAQLNRSTTLSAAGLAFLQIRPALDLEDEDLGLIADWLRTTASALVDHYSSADVDRNSTRNNHRYWAGLAAAAAGLASRDRNIFEWGMDACWSGIGHVTELGALPLELDRGKRALYYHAYATGPLVMLAEISARNGRDLYRGGDGALHRLVAFTLANLDDPRQIERLAGSPQEPLGQDGTPFAPHQIAWLELYDRRFPARNRWRGRMQDLRPFAFTALGGNLTLLSGAGREPRSSAAVSSTLRGRQT
ncbi:MAG: alginate lyase family protein [Caulobacteraceae bacterium]|nr:alginate lyase family protein [Caulobacteraceae bacterium]